jgi:hypothetical protein
VGTHIKGSLKAQLRGFETLLEGLRCNATLRTLNLSTNKVVNEEAVMVAKVLIVYSSDRGGDGGQGADSIL